MTLLSPFADPVALKLLGAARGGRAWASVVPPAADHDNRRSIPLDEDQRVLVELLAVGLLGDPPGADVLGTLEHLIDEHVVTWTPSLQLRTRDALFAALCNADDAIADIEVTSTLSVAVPEAIHLEWTVAGTFRRAGFLNDDVLIEPSGAHIEAAGMLATSFSAGRIARICCYYDRLAILEQVLRPAPTP